MRTHVSRLCETIHFLGQTCILQRTLNNRIATD